MGRRALRLRGSAQHLRGHGGQRELDPLRAGPADGGRAEQRLFAPLGIREFHWKRTPAGETDAEEGLYLHPRDLAKLGYLYLRGGSWQDRRILPEGWVEAATRPWVVPEYELIAVSTGWNIYGSDPLSEDYTLAALIEAVRTAP